MCGWLWERTGEPFSALVTGRCVMGRDVWGDGTTRWRGGVLADVVECAGVQIERADDGRETLEGARGGTRLSVGV